MCSSSALSVYFSSGLTVGRHNLACLSMEARWRFEIIDLACIGILLNRKTKGTADLARVEQY